jgi:hypothetical protein
MARFRPFLRLREFLGLLEGYAIGPVTGAISFIRRSRMFHPRGVTYVAAVSPTDEFFLPLPENALVRFSSAWWKNKEWIDVLGIAIRFSNNREFTEVARAGDQDLLFATVRSPWVLPIAPLTTQFHDYLGNDYFAVSPFSVGGESISRYGKFRLRPLKPSEPGRNREVRLLESTEKNEASFELEFFEFADPLREWQSVANIDLVRPIALEQEKLRFDPFRSGVGIRPRGLIHYLRIGAYGFSQALRPSSR